MRLSRGLAPAPSFRGQAEDLRLYLLRSEASWPQCCSLVAEFGRHALFCGTAITPQKCAFLKGTFCERLRRFFQLSGRLPGRGAAFRRGWLKRHFDSTIKRNATLPPQVKMDFGSDAAIVGSTP
jgi:hypothetical protein